MKKYENAYEIPAHIRELFGEDEEHLTASQMRELKEWMHRLKGETRVAYFLRTSHCNLLHDTPVMGACERQFTDSYIEGPFSREPHPKKPPFDSGSETRKSIETRLFPNAKLPAFTPVLYQHHEARVYLGDMDSKALKQAQEYITEGLGMLKHRKPAQRKNEYTNMYSGRVRECVYELAVVEPGVTRTQVPLELRVFGREDAVMAVNRALTQAWSCVASRHVAGSGHVIEAKNGLAYQLDLNKATFKDIEKENVIV
jgi:hypothetical protein